MDEEAAMASSGDLVAVIEDEEDARTSLMQLFEFEGFRVCGFANGAEALTYLRNSELPCVIVMDMRMPVMDGPRFRAAQRQDPRLAKIPVVVLTAFDSVAAAGLAALRVFRKPVNFAALLGTIRDNC